MKACVILEKIVFANKEVRFIENYFKLYNDDCLNVLKEIERNSIDLIITSPPYNVDLGNNKYKKDGYSLYSDNKEHDEYISWLKEVFSQCYSLLRDGGRVCINVGSGKNGRIPTHSDIIQFMTKDLSYSPFTQIIWNKKQVSNRCAWGSFNSPSCPSFPTPFEHILVFYKTSPKLLKKGESDLTKDEFIEWSSPIWEFQPELKQKTIGHPAMFPIELPTRCMKMFSYKNSTVLDPFMGAGTTGVACVQNNRNFIGIEIDKNYFDIAKERIGEENKYL